MAKQAADAVSYGDNTRGSGQYRHSLAVVYVKTPHGALKGKECEPVMEIRFRLKWKTGSGRGASGYGAS